MAWSLVGSVWSSESCNPCLRHATTGRCDWQNGSEAPGGHSEIQVEKIPRLPSAVRPFLDSLLSGEPAIMSWTDLRGKELRLLANSHGHELRRGLFEPSRASDVCNPCRETVNQSHWELKPLWAPDIQRPCDKTKFAIWSAWVFKGQYIRMGSVSPLHMNGSNCKSVS